MGAEAPPGLASDAEYIASVVNQIDGPVLLVGHSFASARPRCWTR